MIKYNVIKHVLTQKAKNAQGNRNIISSFGAGLERLGGKPGNHLDFYNNVQCKTVYNVILPHVTRPLSNSIPGVNNKTAQG